MTTLLIAVLLQSALLLPPRSDLESPALYSTLPQKARKDYDKLWMRFISGKDDKKLIKDIRKFIKKQKSSDPALIIEAYVDLYRGDDTAARQKLRETLHQNPKNRVALYYLAELEFAHKQYSAAADLYSQLLADDSARSDLETKKERALLLAAEDLLQAAMNSERENRWSDAEQYYRRSLSIAPNDPTLHARLADALAKQDKREAAEAERKLVEELSPDRPTAIQEPEVAKADDLEDLGRWADQIEVFHQIRTADAVTRAQLAVLLVRYFPQIAEFTPVRSEIMTDIQNSPASVEIQAVVGLRLIEPFPNHTFAPQSLVTRMDLAASLAGLVRHLGVSEKSLEASAIPDLSPTNARYSDIKLVLEQDLMSLVSSGGFDPGAPVSGHETVLSIERLLRKFQEEQR